MERRGWSVSGREGRGIDGAIELNVGGIEIEDRGLIDGGWRRDGWMNG